MGHLTSERGQQEVEWRRSQVLQYSSQGYSTREIAQKLQIGKSSIDRDIQYLKHKAQENLRHHIHEVVPMEYEQCMIGMKHNLKRVLEIADSTADSRLKLQASSIANECYRDIMDLCTNAGIVSDALKFVERKTEKLVSANASVNNAQTTTETEETDTDGLSKNSERELEEQQTHNGIF